MNQKILLLIVIYTCPRISFSLEKKNIKIFQFTKYAEKVIFPDKVQRIK